MAFENLYCITFQMMDAQWLAKRASYMDFNVLLLLPCTEFMGLFFSSLSIFFFSSFKIIHTALCALQDVLKSTRTQLEHDLSLEDVSSVQDLPAYVLLKMGSLPSF